MIDLQFNYPSVSEEVTILGNFMREFRDYHGSLAFPDYRGEKYNLNAAIQ